MPEPGRTGGRRGTGDGRRKGGKRERIKKCKLSLLLTSSQRNEHNNVSRLPLNVLRGLKQIRTRNKKKTKHSITSSEIGNLSKSLTS